MEKKEVILTVANLDTQYQLLDYLKEHGDLSGRLVKRLHKEDKIKVNDKRVRLDYKVKIGDKISVILEELKSTDIMPQDIPINILYEDNDVLVVDKPPFMVVHPTPNNQEGTLSNAIAFHFSKQGFKGSVRLVSRLDRDTSGVILIAKSSLAHSRLSQSMEQNQILKQYQAITQGKINKDEGIIDAAIGKDENDPIKRTVTKQGSMAKTIYKVLKRLDNITLLELTLLTGRTHQIRVHLKHIGHPILGDHLYGKNTSLIDRQALHAYRLKFDHPITGDIIDITSPLPEDMKVLIT